MTLQKCNPQSPFLIIGAGRSGSTLLSAVFNHHPLVSFFGETYFLAPAVWERIFNEYGLIMSFLVEWRQEEGDQQASFRKTEERRIARLIARFMMHVLRIDQELPFWGYKEIWNGSPHFETHEWDIYDRIFPNAKYIHLVRNPIRFAVSTAGRSDQPFDRKTLAAQLANWVRIHEFNIQRADRQYYLLRYEDLVSKQQSSMKSLLGFLDIPWDEGCLKAFEKKYVPSFRDPLSDPEIIKDPIEIPGLYKYASSLGYLNEIEEMGILMRNC